MTTLVIGTAGSGKSAFAEDLVLSTKDKVRYYVATMKVMDEAGRERVLAHRKRRSGKGFVTIECEREIGKLADSLERAEESTVLLECVSNLVANRMHDGPDRAALTEPVAADEAFCISFADAAAEEIRELSQRVHNLIIVTNDYEKNDPGYDEETLLYIRLLDLVNERLAAFADRVVDVRKK